MAQSSGEVIALAVVFTVLELFLIGLRLFARRARKQTLGSDDYLIIAAGLLFVLCITVPIIIQCVDANLGNNVQTDASGQPLPPTYLFEVLERIFECASVVPLALTKLSILRFYQRIFRGKVFSVITWASLALVLVWGVSYFFTLLFLCTPTSTYVHQGPTGEGVHCVNELQVYYSLAISEVILDVIIWCIPIPFVWRLHMVTKLKIAVSGAFALGLIAIAASIARMVTFVHEANLIPEEQMNYTYFTAPTSYWTLIEASLAIVSACLPTLRPAFQGFSPESIIRSVRSKISVMSTPRSSKESVQHGVHGNTGHSASATHLRGSSTVSGNGHDVELGNVPPLPKDAVLVKSAFGSHEDSRRISGSS